MTAQDHIKEEPTGAFTLPASIPLKQGASTSHLNTGDSQADAIVISDNDASQEKSRKDGGLIDLTVERKDQGVQAEVKGKGKRREKGKSSKAGDGTRARGEKQREMGHRGTKRERNAPNSFTQTGSGEASHSGGRSEGNLEQAMATAGGSSSGLLEEGMVDLDDEPGIKELREKRVSFFSSNSDYDDV